MDLRSTPSLIAADPVSQVEPTRPAHGLRREPAGLPGAQVARHHNTDRNDARGLAHLARTGFFNQKSFRLDPLERDPWALVARQSALQRKCPRIERVRWVLIPLAHPHSANLPHQGPPTSTANSPSSASISSLRMTLTALKDLDVPQSLRLPCACSGSKQPAPWSSARHASAHGELALRATRPWMRRRPE
jgi:hypothetical protein